MVQFSLNEIAFKKFGLIDGGDQEAYNNAIREANGGDVIPDETDPLARDAYPLQPSVARVLRKESNGDAIVLPGDIQLPRPDNQYDPDPSRPEYWNLEPILPGNPDFLKELHEVVKLQIARREGQDPAMFYRFPDVMTEGRVDYMRNIGDADNYELSLEDIANAVKNEYPVSIQQTFLRGMFQDLPAILNLGQPFRSARDFIGMQVRIARINAWSFEVVAPVNFMLKWNYGMSRPEEVAWLIANNRIRDDLASTEVGPALVSDIMSMHLTSRKDFTAYRGENDNGCPTHPSFPAMHSAGSTLSMWLPALFKLTPEDYEQVLLVDHAVAVARTVAGVHYPQDNIAGLNIGQRIIREQLPSFVAREYGYDATLVKERLDRLSFDWKTFDSKNLMIGDQTVQAFYEEANRGVRTINNENI